ncbi:salivary endonuclease-like [Hetaerina americana]|uniref:salivary endonuclease-like n=1 Tax=Hetaerina americana TaxID=62018 RepID=UPI003A7F1208
MDPYKLGTRASATCDAIGRIIRTLTIIFVLCQVPSVYTAQNRNCIVALGPYPNRHFPVIATRTRGILFPAGNRSIVIQKKETVRVSCPGKNNSIVGQNVATLDLSCKESGRLELPHSSTFTINCTKEIDESLNETNIHCGSNSNSKKIYIGWPLPNGGTFHQVEVCFNYLKLATEYTLHTIIGDSVPYRDRDVSWQGRASFKQDKFFSELSPSIASSYTKEKQKETLTALLGSRERAEYYVGGWGPSSYLAKGHLSPDADFALQSWQDATYHFINVVPQWQEFNNGNWKVLENAIRVKATRPSPHNLVVYTGTFGVLQLQDINRNEIPFYLSLGPKNRVPVPKYIWKIASNPSRNESVAFVLLNHPATTPPYSEPPVCQDVCNRIHWVTWKARNDVHKGVMYCCSVPELRRIFTNIPNNVPVGKLMES